MTPFGVQVTNQTISTIELAAHIPEDAILGAIAEIRRRDDVAEPVILSVLDPDAVSGNPMPLQEWSAD